MKGAKEGKTENKKVHTDGAKESKTENKEVTQKGVKGGGGAPPIYYRYSMDFNQIDEQITQNAAANSISEQLDDQLDTYHLDKLKNIYHKLTGRNPQLLKRTHLCQEIHLLHRNWLKNQSDGNQTNYQTMLNKLMLYVNLTDCSDFQTVTFCSTEPINYQLFDLNEWTYYQKCYDELLYRSQLFNQLCANYQTIKPDMYGEIFDTYFGELYLDYQSSDRNYLLTLLIGLNLFPHQILKIEFSNSNQNSITLIYHPKIRSMGYFHLTHPNYLVRNSDTRDYFNYSDCWIYHSLMYYRFTIVENPLQNASNEFFQQLATEIK